MSDNHEWIGKTYLSDFGWNVLEDLAEIGARLGASEGERKGHDRVRKAFRKAGLRNINEHTFQMTRWRRSGAGVKLNKPRDRTFDAIALPGSPSGQVRGEVEHLHHGLPEDFENRNLSGKIVIARSDVPSYYDRWIHRREKYYRAVDAGADAFVFQNHVEGCLPPTGSLGGGEKVLGEIPAVGISKETGAHIQRYTQNSQVEGTVEVQAQIDEGTSQNVTGEVGPDTDETILVGAHVDGHDISQAAIDNGAGTAIVCEIARILSDLEDQLKTRVRLIGFGAEELGLIGSQRYARDHALDDLKLVVNCDGIGRGRNMKVHTNEFEGITPIVESVADRAHHPIEAVPEMVLHSDHWPFVWNGVPGIMVSSETGEQGRGFGHTYADTLEKVDVREIREHAILATMMIQEFARTDVDIPRRDPENIQEQLEQKGHDTWMKTARDWPF